MDLPLLERAQRLGECAVGARDHHVAEGVGHTNDRCARLEEVVLGISAGEVWRFVAGPLKIAPRPATGTTATRSATRAGVARVEVAKHDAVAFPQFVAPHIVCHALAERGDTSRQLVTEDLGERPPE